MNKLIYLAIYVSLTFACAYAYRANADDLVVDMNGQETYWSGMIEHAETDGLTGTVTLLNALPPSFSEYHPPTPSITGLWRIGVQVNGKNTQIVAHCYATTAYTADHGTRVVLTCLSGSSK